MLSAESRDSSLASIVVRGILIAALLYSVAQILDSVVNRTFMLSDLPRLIWLRSYRMALMQEAGTLCLALLGATSAIGLWKRKQWALAGIKIWAWLLILEYLVLHFTFLYITSVDAERSPYTLTGALFRAVLGLAHWAAMPVFFLVLLRNETVLGYFQDTRTKGFEVISASLPASNDDARS